MPELTRQMFARVVDSGTRLHLTRAESDVTLCGRYAARDWNGKAPDVWRDHESYRCGLCEHAMTYGRASRFRWLLVGLPHEKQLMWP